MKNNLNTKIYCKTPTCILDPLSNRTKKSLSKGETLFTPFTQRNVGYREYRGDL